MVENNSPERISISSVARTLRKKHQEVRESKVIPTQTPPVPHIEDTPLVVKRKPLPYDQEKE